MHYRLCEGTPTVHQVSLAHRNNPTGHNIFEEDLLLRYGVYHCPVKIPYYVLTISVY